MRKKEHYAIKTLKQAKRAVIIVIGFTAIMFGCIMILTPGPGLATIVAGLALLGTEFVWARRLLKRFGKEANNVKNAIHNNYRNIIK